ncbi:molybdopterin-dependent oxidoreductase [Pusillimonas sp. ANT_WB101]|uniref:molybdopterin-dependent oxidoreductase n=1 Tax=Pusillimonas sp. ANT_WB101 TaxID=2597356 RepID=UPI0011EBE142|nr:molybdopterin-dependent oxidoreductase [Pusillimonas sp. ANT_WB101]KAA0889405.1 molybdopterin-dependent oxidoreductase [Pusillimonas sp. ANT_WB101]
MNYRNEGNIDRRTFLKTISAAGGAVGLSSVAGFTSLAHAAQAQTAVTPTAAAPTGATIIHGKSAEMIVHNGKLGVMETPLNLLREHRSTPVDLIYSRNHFPIDGAGSWIATTDPASHETIQNWTILVSGLVQRPKTIKVADLEQMDHVKRVAVMQCAGNGRSYYWDKAKTPGSGWKHGGMANLTWEGVPLKALLKSLDLSPAASVKFLTANGKDEPPVPGGADMIKSFHLEAPQMDDAILAVRLNGKPIPSIHGGPVRLIIPGYYGNMNVKWLTDLLLMDEPTPSAIMQKTYRMPIMPVEPGKFTTQDLTRENSTPTYGFAIMSVVFAPLSGQTAKAGDVELKGVAWNDGLASLDDIRVSLDQGKTWQTTDIDNSDGPYAWHYWNTHVKLEPGKYEVWVRATDAWGRTQPMSGLSTWNPGGWDWHGIDRVPFEVA